MFSIKRPREIFVLDSRLVFTGPSVHYFHAWLERNFPKGSRNAALKKLLLDRTLFCPTYLLIYLYLLALFEVSGKYTAVALWGIIFLMRPANKRQCYIVTASLIGRAHHKTIPALPYVQCKILGLDISPKFYLPILFQRRPCQDALAWLAGLFAPGHQTVGDVEALML